MRRTEGSRQSKQKLLVLTAYCFLPSAFSLFSPHSAIGTPAFSCMFFKALAYRADTLACS